MPRTGTGNPVIVIGELEKAGGSDRNGRLHDTLLALLEPETAVAWPDECLQASRDLSQVSWVCTANTVTGFPAPLLSRVRIIHTGTPHPAHWPALLEGLRRDLAEDLGVPLDALPCQEPEAEDAPQQALEGRPPCAT